MNKDQAEGLYEQMKGSLKKTWGRLSDNDLALYNGEREKFYGKLQQEYGIAREEAEKQIKELEKACQKSSQAA